MKLSLLTKLSLASFLFLPALAQPALAQGLPEFRDTVCVLTSTSCPGGWTRVGTAGILLDKKDCAGLFQVGSDLVALLWCKAHVTSS